MKMIKGEKTVKKYLWHGFGSVIQFTLYYFAFIENIEGIQNLVFILTWVGVISMWLVLLFEKNPKPNDFSPKYLLFRLLLSTSVFGFGGWFFTAFVHFFTGVFYVGSKMEAKSKKQT